MRPEVRKVGADSGRREGTGGRVELQGEDRRYSKWCMPGFRVDPSSATLVAGRY